VAEILDDLYTGSVNHSLAFLDSNSEIKILITDKPPNSYESKTLI
jgi:hypothetical protein